ncbi:hypothetical protein Tco_0709885 [Tanacetum coccineum]
MSSLLPAIDCREDVPKANVSPRKRFCLTAPAPRFEVGERSVAAAARQPGLDVTPTTDYSFVDTMDATPGCPMSRERVTDLAATLARDTHEIMFDLRTPRMTESEARYARQAWSQAMDCNMAVHAELLAYRAEVRALREQITSIALGQYLHFVSHLCIFHCVGIKSLLNAASITAAHIRVNAAQLC